MCGRSRCSLAREAITSAAGVPEQRWRDQGHYRPSYNCSPGAWMPVLKLGADGARELQTMKWGLVPAFTRLSPGERPDHFRMFNARSEGLTQKPVFSRLLPSKRCVVLLDGFYEWHSQGGGGGAASRKQPYHITTVDGPKQPAMYMAGLYDVYSDGNGEPLPTFTIITTDSSKPLAWLHDRMPVILTTPEEVSAWLGEAKWKGADAGAAKAEGADRPDVVPLRDKQAESAGGAAPAAHPLPSSPAGANAAAAAVVAVATVAASPAAERETAEPVGMSSVSPSTPSSIGCRGRMSAGAASAEGPEPGSGSTRKAPAGTDTAHAIEILDDEDGGDGVAGRRRHGAGGSGDRGDGEGGAGESGEGDDDDDDERWSQGKVGSSQEEMKEKRPRRGRSGKPAVSEAVRQHCEELVEKICRPYGGPLLKWHPVTPEMSKAGYDKPDCCKDVRTKKGSISSFFKPAAKGAGAGSASPAAAAPVKKEEPSPPPQQQQQQSASVKDAGGALKSAGQPAGADAAGCNPDECEGADGRLGKGGVKRPAEAEGVGAALAKKR